MNKAILVLLACAIGAWRQDPQLLVLLKGANALAFCTWEGVVVDSAPVGTHPHEMVQSPDGKFAYVTDNGAMRIEHTGDGGNTVSVFDLTERKTVTRISLGKYHRPHGIDLDPKTGRLVVTAERPDQLLLVDVKSGSVIRTYNTKGKTPHMVKLGPKGEWASASNSLSGNVAAVHLDSGEVKLIPTGERPEGGEIKTSRGPVRIEIAPDGALVYAAMHEKKVEFADPKTRKVIASVDVGGTPVSLHLSGDGKHAFAAAEEQDTVYIISVEDKKLTGEFRTGTGAGPDPVQTFTP